jgi:hypothetical protein
VRVAVRGDELLVVRRPLQRANLVVRDNEVTSRRLQGDWLHGHLRLGVRRVEARARLGILPLPYLLCTYLRLGVHRVEARAVVRVPEADSAWLG